MDVFIIIIVCGLFWQPSTGPPVSV